MTSDAFKRSLKIHQEKGFFKNLKILRGIERESLRVTQEGKISQNNLLTNYIPLWLCTILPSEKDNQGVGFVTFYCFQFS